MKNYVIIGNGAAAAGCIEGIRAADKTGKITVISKEQHPVYCRPLISYYLEGKTTLERMHYRAPDFYEKNGCRVLYGVEATALNPNEKTVTLSNGEQLLYSEVCVATGSSPFVPPMKGLETVLQKFNFLTVDDALALEEAVTKTSRILIVGAGLIGLKCAEGLKNRVQSVTVCDLADRVLSSILDAPAAAFMQKHLEQNGLTFLLNNSVEQFSGNTARFTGGQTLEFDQLVLAVGVRPNVGLVKNAGGSCGRGITVNSAMQTSLPFVFAAGDCTESTDISDNTVKIMALMPNAYMQGFCAGSNMAGKAAGFQNAIPMNAIGFFGLHAMTAGSRPGPEQGGKVYTEQDEKHIKKLYSKNGLLTGFILIGQTERAGIYTSLIRNKIPLNSVDYEALKKAPNLFAFGQEYRRNKLGGVV